jgi:lipoyl(octanoyl) transferase
MPVYYRLLGLCDYAQTLLAMQQFTTTRNADTADELWCLQHHPVFTQGYAGKAEHILAAGDIPVVNSDRGGQVTYHGPGQLLVYTLIDLRRMGLKIRDLIHALETAVIDVLATFSINAQGKPKAPGVYVDDAKICSFGLRVKQHCSFHGLALNVAMDLQPFSRINPCGFENLSMTQMQAFHPEISVSEVQFDLLKALTQQLGYTAQIPRNTETMADEATHD